MKNRLSRGFTLIELLVVIAIIGILSSVVLASLNTARSKGANAAVKSNLANARAQAELFYDANGSSYKVAAGATNLCDATASVGGVKGINPSVLAAAVAGAGSSATVVLDTLETATTGACNSAATTWVAQAPLKVPENGSNYYCVDSTGQAKGEAAALLAAATVCL